MEAEVRRWILSHDLVRPGDTVTCAVSGGADSMALLCCLLSLREELGFTLNAAHFNHLLRGTESDADERFVAAFCREQGIPFFPGRGSAAEEGARTGRSTEEAARELRYEFLLSCPGKIATAHTADDNCETVLMNLIRGTGLKGLCGIPVQRDRMIRPMLSVTHEEAMAYLASLSRSWREDSTNIEDFCRRNRLRHHVIPLLKEENPALAETVLRCCETLRPELACLEQEAEALLRRSEVEDGLSCAILSAAPEPILRRALRLRAGKDFDAAVTERLLSLIRKGNGRCALPDGTVIHCSCGVLCHAAKGPAPEPVSLSPSETVRFGEYEISCEAIDMPPPARSAREPVLRLARLTLPLTVRGRKSGDTISTAAGEKLLKELMIDKKLPAPLRDSLPVFVSGGEIAAVYRLEVAEGFRAAEGEACVSLRVRHKGQAGNR